MTETAPSTDAPPCPVPDEFLEWMVEQGLWTEGELTHALEEAPPRWGTPVPDDVDHVSFDIDEVIRVLQAMQSLRHTKTRRWQGSPFIPTAWQVIWIIAPVWGWRYDPHHPDPELAGTRVIRTVFVEIPRKNGKSTLVSALLIILLCADGEAGPEVYTGATDREQAKIIFNAAKQMVEASPKLRRRVGQSNIQAKLIRYPRNGGIFRSLSRVADAAHGLNVSGAAIDELHLHRKRDLYDAIDTGTGARSQPLVIVITTADEGDEHTVYDEQHGSTVRQAEGVYRDDSHYGVIWAAPEDADPFADETIARCNPGAGVTVTWHYLRKKRDKARNEPSFLNTYLRLHLNVRKRAKSRLLRVADWKHQDCIQMLDRDRLGKAEAFGGLDLSSSTDFTAFTALTGPPDDDGMFDVVAKFWLPEERAEQIERLCRVPIERWVDQGWITLTEGNVVDYRAVRSGIGTLKSGEVPQLRRIGYDPWNANETVTELGESGFAMVPVRQGYASLSAPTKFLERKTIEHAFRHGGNPVLAWMASCLDVRRDNNGNMRPDKPEIDRSSARIDGMAALLMSLFCWLKWGAKSDAPRRTVRARSIR